ncbi:TRAP-type C4-dicarboxylate transport system, small permease component [Paracoccus isoporae]|uniref:TRAP transporter small permease protein n=1 Tax=Paracoccus isoporae TaxID=591205 RepID=A0A1G7H129_9RHOB|nr:TRAP transporter small permease subunit [Paracoccus isoporae]SDE94117.1 TRAP-type C4-dicarboxylate transport system, small permease component [Paracoccus isoporae]
MAIDTRPGSGAIQRVLTLIDRFDHWVTTAIRPIVVALGLLIAFAFAAGVFFRSVVGSPVFGLEELVLLAAMWFYLLGAGLASSERSHLSADFLPMLLGDGKAAQAVQLFATALSLMMAVFILVWSLDLVSWGLDKRQGTPVFGIPWVVSQASLMFGACLFIIYLSRDFLRDLLVLLGAREAD